MLLYAHRFRNSLIILSALLVVQVNANDFFCEKIQTYVWSHNDNQITCFMNFLTKKPATRFSLAKHQQTKGLRFQANKNVTKLPENLSFVFSGLTFFNAESCAVQTLTNKNFKNLTNLRKIWLNNNEIESIDSDVFQDNKLLTFLTLGKIRIVKR